MKDLKKGDVFWAELPASNGSVQSGKRPVLILGNDAACKYAPIITVLPITSKIEKKHKIPTHVLLKNALKKESIVLTEQIRTIPKEYLLGNRIYSLTSEEEKSVTKALIYQLGLELGVLAEC